MNTTTTKKRSRKGVTNRNTPNPFDITGMVDKRDVATELALLVGDDELYPIGYYDPDNCLYINNNPDKPDLDTLGHTFRLEMEGIESGAIFLDDRQGDLRLQLAAAMEHRAKLYLAMAKQCRAEAKK